MTTIWHALLAPLRVPDINGRTLDSPFALRASTGPVPVMNKGAIIGSADAVTVDGDTLTAVVTFVAATPEEIEQITDGRLLPAFSLDDVLCRMNARGGTDVYAGRVTSVVLHDRSLSGWPDVARLTVVG